MDKDLSILDIDMPVHIAVIPDGNRRWAKARGKLPLAGHKAGVEAYRRLLENAAEFGIKYVTFYAFSTENWKRKESEIQGIMGLFLDYIRNFDSVIGPGKNKIRFIVIGNRDKFSQDIVKAIERIEFETKDNKDLTAYICVDYGGRSEITRACQALAKDVRDGKLNPDDITESCFSDYLFTYEAPDPDLLIRTSGEERISNFLLWQLAYTEFYFTDMYWPDFDKDALIDALKQYSKRQRRYGGK